MALTRPSPARPVDEQKPAPAAVIDLRDIFVILKRQAKWVFWSALICTLMGTIVAFALPTRYTATAQILLDVHGLQVMQGDLTRAWTGQATRCSRMPKVSYRSFPPAAC